MSFLDFSDYGNTRRKYLQEQIQQEDHNLLCYSKNLLMTEPKVGYNNEWGNTKERVALVQQMLNEIPDSQGISTYVGRILDWFKSADGRYLVKFEVSSPIKSLKPDSICHIFCITEELYNIWVSRYESEFQSRLKEDKPDILKVKVKQTTIYEMKWVEDWYVEVESIG